MAQWRHRNALLLNNARHVLAPSQDTASRIAGFVPGARVQAVAHTDMPAQLPTPTARTLAATAPLKIVVLGAMSAIKGADVLEAVAIEAAKRGAPVEFHLLGYGYRSLQTQPRARLTVHGGYKEDELPALLDWLQPDLAWFPAQWPETYSYTLSACLAAGLPIVAPDIGAFPKGWQAATGPGSCPGTPATPNGWTSSRKYANATSLKDSCRSNRPQQGVPPPSRERLSMATVISRGCSRAIRPCSSHWMRPSWPHIACNARTMLQDRGP